jgi:hypothetical protein
LRSRAYQALSSGLQEEVRCPDRHSEEEKDTECRLAGPRGLPDCAGRARQRKQARREQTDVDPSLPARTQAPDESVGVEIAQEKHDLKEEQAGRPDCRGPAKPRQNHLGDQWLHLEQKGRADENGQSVE